MTFHLVTVGVVPIWYLTAERYLGEGLPDGEAENDRAQRWGDTATSIGQSRLLGRGQSWLRPARVRWRAQGWIAMHRHGNVKRRLTLGTYPAISLAEAREKAGRAHHAVQYDDASRGERRFL